jgi:hypothetical protein
MRRPSLLLLAVAAPAVGQTGGGDGGLPGATAVLAGPDAGVRPQAAASLADRVGRHFALTWDTRGPRPGESDVQAWLTPRWGRADDSTWVAVRAGVLQGLPRDFAAGVFIDAFPSTRGVNQDTSIDARLTLHVQNRGRLGDRVGYGSQAEIGAGVNGLAVWVLAALDADLGAVRIALNADAFTQTGWKSKPGDAFGTARVRQTLGLSYTLANGFSAGLEVQNRLAWLEGSYLGDALLIGPAVAYRGTRFWWTVSLLPQVAAVKPDPPRAGAEPLELVDGERFTLRVAAGVVAR